MSMSPIFAMYGIGISSLSFLDLVLFFVLVLGFARVIFSYYREGRAAIMHYQDVIFFSVLVFFCFYIVFISVYHLLAFPELNGKEDFFRALRVVLYLVLAIFFSVRVDFYMFLRALTNVALFVSIFLLYQYFSMYFLGYYPKGYVDILPQLRPQVVSFSESITYYESWIRARSVLGEPSQIGLLVGLALLLRLSHNSTPVFSLANFILLIGLLCSKSTTSYMVLLICFVVFLHRNFGLAGTIVFGLGILLFSVGWAFYVDWDGGRHLRSFSNRTMRYDFSSLFYSDYVLLGKGYNDVVKEIWLPSASRLILSFGIVGFFLFIAAVISMTSFSFVAIVFSLVYVFFLFGNEVALSNWNILYIPVFLYLRQLKSGREYWSV